MQLFVQGIGKTLSIQISPTEDVKELNLMIQDRTGVPGYMQCLCFQGKVLNWGSTLGGYGINQDCTVFCSIRPPAFGFECSTHGLDSLTANSTQLHNAILDDHFYCAKTLILKVGLDDLVKDCTALMLAIKKNNMDLAEFMVSRCNLGKLSPKHGTALHLACKLNNPQATKLMVQWILSRPKTKKNTIEMEDSSGNTPLHVACKFGSTACAEELLKADIENAIGETPLHLAMRKGRVFCSYLLLKQGADVNYLNSNGDTPIDIYKPIADQSDLAGNDSDIGEDLRFLLDNPSFCDVIFSVKGRDIHAHKCILAARSEYFRGMFLGSMRESQNATINIADVEFTLFWAMIEFLYTNRLVITSDTMAMELLVLADQYCIVSLKTLCIRSFKGFLTVQNIAKNFSQVLMVPLVDARFQSLLHCCGQYVTNNWDQIVKFNRHSDLSYDMIRIAASMHSMEQQQT